MEWGLEASEGGVEEFASAAATWVWTVLMMVEKKASTDMEEVPVALLMGGVFKCNDAKVLPDASGLDPNTSMRVAGSRRLPKGKMKKTSHQSAELRKQMAEMQQMSLTQHMCTTIRLAPPRYGLLGHDPP